MLIPFIYTFIFVYLYTDNQFDMKTKDYIIIAGGVVVILIVAICIYLSFDDLGIWNHSFRQTTLGKVSYYIGGTLTAFKLWEMLQKLFALVVMVFVLLFIVFIICGIGVALGF